MTVLRSSGIYFELVKSLRIVSVAANWMQGITLQALL
jgi:hypothetical protein